MLLFIILLLYYIFSLLLLIGIGIVCFIVSLIFEPFPKSTSSSLYYSFSALLDNFGVENGDYLPTLLELLHFITFCAYFTSYFYFSAYNLHFSRSSRHNSSYLFVSSRVYLRFSI